jgi:hypothetical protein
MRFLPVAANATKVSSQEDVRDAVAPVRTSFFRAFRGLHWPVSGEVAQLVEHTAENRGVAGSIPALAIFPRKSRFALNFLGIPAEIASFRGSRT